jgi:hypothetical protein
MFNAVSDQNHGHVALKKHILLINIRYMILGKDCLVG